MNTLMHFDGQTCEMTCYAPADEEVLTITEPDVEKAHAISGAIQEAYKNGWRLGRLSLQLEIERLMDEKNA